MWVLRSSLPERETRELSISYLGVFPQRAKSLDSLYLTYLKIEVISRTRLEEGMSSTSDITPMTLSSSSGGDVVGDLPKVTVVAASGVGSGGKVSRESSRGAEFRSRSNSSRGSSQRPPSGPKVKGVASKFATPLTLGPEGGR